MSDFLRPTGAGIALILAVNLSVLVAMTPGSQIALSALAGLLYMVAVGLLYREAP